MRPTATRTPTRTWSLRIALTLGVLAASLAVGPVPSTSAQTPVCSPAGGVPLSGTVVQRNANGSFGISAGSGSWTCAIGTSYTLELRTAPTNLLASLLINGSSRTTVGAVNQGLVVHSYTVPDNVLSPLLLGSPACFRTTLTVRAVGSAVYNQSFSNQGCG